MKNKKLFIGSGLVMITAVAVLPMLVGAAPGFPPPNGLTYASFNSITSGNAATTSLSGGTFYGRVEGVDAYATNADGMAGYFEAQVSGQGVRGKGRGAYAGVAGYNDDATGQGVYGSSANGTGGKFDGLTYGVYAQTTTGTAGYFSGNTTAVSLGTAANSIEATAGIKNQNLTIASNGDISNTNANPVVVTDTEGLRSTGDLDLQGKLFNSNDASYGGGIYLNDSASVSGNLVLSGNLMNSAAGVSPVRISDDNGLVVGKHIVFPSSDVNYFVASSNGISNPESTINGGSLQVSDNQGFKVADDAGTVGLVVAANGDITDAGGDVIIGESAYVSGNITSTGTVTAPGLVATNGLQTTNYITTTGYISTGGNISSGGNLTASGGNIGAGTGFPSARVHGTGSTYGVRGEGSTSGGYFLDSNSTGYVYLGYGDRGLWGYGSFAGGTFSDTDSGIWVDAAQGVYSIRGNGRVSGTVWEVFSDIRLKDVIGEYTIGLNEVLTLNPVEFSYKKGNSLKINSDDKHIGLIAQDVHKVIPQAVYEGENGFLELVPDVVMFTLINAIKELKLEKDAEVATLREELAELKTVVCELKPTAEYCGK